MFYDHRILTQRKYGVATVWLVATIGSKSSLSKKVHKKEILQVNLAKACNTIVQSENPLALRLQSNLLFGVSRVFFEQYNYLFADVSNIHQKISREIFVNLDTGRIDLAGVKVRPELLLLADDPAFVPELAYILPEFTRLPEDQLHNATQFTLEDKTLLPSELCGPLGQLGSHGNSPMGQLVVPDLSSPMGGSFLQSDHRNAELLPGDIFEEDIDFVFDENGELQDVSPKVHPAAANADKTLADQQPNRHRRWDSMSAVSDKVRQEHAEGRNIADMNENLLNLDDFQDDQFVPMDLDEEAAPAEPFQRRESPEAETPQEEPEEPEVLARKRVKKVRTAQADDTLELRTSQLAALGANYLENMEQARQKKVQFLNMHAAKKAAISFVYGWNGALRAEALQLCFDGKNLLQIIKPGNFKRQVNRRKRASSLSEGSDGSEQGRRVRGEPYSDFVGDDFAQELGDVNMQDAALDDQGLEIGRRASELDLSAMPWNIPRLSSRAGSVVSLGGIGTSSVGKMASSIRGGSLLRNRHLKSPLVGISKRIGKPRVPISSSPSLMGARQLLGDGLHLSDDVSPIDELPEELYSDQHEAVGAEDLDLEFHPDDLDAAGLENSQWAAETLEKEGQNFFEYLAGKITEKYDNEDLESENANFHSVTFEDLINSKTSTNIVAAQAFHHVLQLATRGVARVEQAEPFGIIRISLVG